VAQRDFDNATRLYVQAFQAGHGSSDDLYLVAQHLRLACATASSGGGGEEGDAAGGADSATQDAEGVGVRRTGGEDKSCLQHAQQLYALVLESDPAHAECALHLASVAYALLLRQEHERAAAATTFHTAEGARPSPDRSASGPIAQWQKAVASGGNKGGDVSEAAAGRRRQRAVEGVWGQVVTWLRHALECAEGAQGMFDRVYSFGMQRVEEGRAGDGATVLTLVVELSQHSHGPAILQCAKVLHHQLGDLDAAADMYASAARVGAADVDMLVDYAQVGCVRAQNLCAKLVLKPARLLCSRIAKAHTTHQLAHSTNARN
jgi:hypothetical protein